MERARAKAKEFGKSLLMRARGGSESSSKNEKTRRPSYNEVVGRPLATFVKRDWGGEASDKGRGAPINCAGKGAGMPQSLARELHKMLQGTSSGITQSPQRLFSADDVAKLVKLARVQLRKEKEAASGWCEVESREDKKKEKTYARRLVDQHQSSPESEPRCWQCNRHGHLSSACPQGERCFICQSPGHKRAECPHKRKASRSEKRKAVETGTMLVKPMAGPLWIGERTKETQRLKAPEHEGGDLDKGKHRGGGGKYNGDERSLGGQAQIPVGSSRLPGRQMERRPATDLQWKKKEGATVVQTNERRRIQTIQPVFMLKTEAAVAGKQALAATGGVISRANGNPTIKDYVDALKKMCASYEN